MIYLNNIPDISPILPQIFTGGGGKKSQIWSRFSAPVLFDFESPAFSNGVMHVKCKQTRRFFLKFGVCVCVSVRVHYGSAHVELVGWCSTSAAQPQVAMHSSFSTCYYCY